jgi:hypothetical protein
MIKWLLRGTVIVFVVLAVVPLVRHRNRDSDLSYDLRGGTALFIYDEAEASDLPLSNVSAAERPSKEDVERLWPLAMEWVVSHHNGAPITNIGLRHLEVSAQSDFANVFVSVRTERGSFVYELKYEWRNGWTVAQWSVTPQDQQGQENMG